MLIGVGLTLETDTTEGLFFGKQTRGSKIVYLWTLIITGFARWLAERTMADEPRRDQRAVKEGRSLGVTMSRSTELPPPPFEHLSGARHPCGGVSRASLGDRIPPRPPCIALAASPVSGAPRPPRQRTFTHGTAGTRRGTSVFLTSTVGFRRELGVGSTSTSSSFFLQGNRRHSRLAAAESSAGSWFGPGDSRAVLYSAAALVRNFSSVSVFSLVSFDLPTCGFSAGVVALGWTLEVCSSSGT